SSQCSSSGLPSTKPRNSSTDMRGVRRGALAMVILPAWHPWIGHAKYESLCCPPRGVEAPGSSTGDRQGQEDEAIEHGELALIQHRVEALRRVRHEIGDCHEARQDEGNRPCKQADQNEQPTNQLKNSRCPEKRHELKVVERRNMRKAEELGGAVL